MTVRTEPSLTIALAAYQQNVDAPEVDESWFYRLPEQYREETVVGGQPLLGSTTQSSAAPHHSRPSLRRALERLNTGTASLRVP